MITSNYELNSHPSQLSSESISVGPGGRTYGCFLNQRRGSGTQALHQAPELLEGTDHDVLACCNVCCSGFVLTACIIHYSL